MPLLCQYPVHFYEPTGTSLTKVIHQVRCIQNLFGNFRNVTRTFHFGRSSILAVYNTKIILVTWKCKLYKQGGEMKVRNSITRLHIDWKHTPTFSSSWGTLLKMKDSWATIFVQVLFDHFFLTSSFEYFKILFIFCKFWIFFIHDFKIIFLVIHYCPGGNETVKLRGIFHRGFVRCFLQSWCFHRCFTDWFYTFRRFIRRSWG